MEVQRSRGKRLAQPGRAERASAWAAQRLACLHEAAQRLGHSGRALAQSQRAARRRLRAAALPPAEARRARRRARRPPSACASRTRSRPTAPCAATGRWTRAPRCRPSWPATCSRAPARSHARRGVAPSLDASARGLRAPYGCRATLSRRCQPAAAHSLQRLARTSMLCVGWQLVEGQERCAPVRRRLRAPAQSEAAPARAPRTRPRLTGARARAQLARARRRAPGRARGVPRGGVVRPRPARELRRPQVRRLPAAARRGAPGRAAHTLHLYRCARRWAAPGPPGAWPKGWAPA